MNKTKIKLPILEAVKWLSVILLLVFIYTLLATGKQSNTDFSAMCDAVTAVSELEGVQLADNQMVKRLYGLSPEEYEGVLLYYPTTNMGAEELLLIKLKSPDQQETIRAAIEARLKTQMDSFDGYGVDQYEMLENSVTDVQGNYILFVVAPDTSSVVKAFEKAL